MPRGRKPKPASLRKLQGNPGKRPLPESPASVSDELPTCPAHLGKIASEEWERVVALLGPAKLAPPEARAALAGYATAWQRWVEAEEKLKDQGPVVKSPNGYPIQNPYLSIANTALKQVKEFMTELGMTPSSRSRIKVHSSEPVDPADEFFNGEGTEAQPPNK